MTKTSGKKDHYRKVVISKYNTRQLNRLIDALSSENVISEYIKLRGELGLSLRREVRLTGEAFVYNRFVVRYYHLTVIVFFLPFFFNTFFLLLTCSFLSL